MPVPGFDTVIVTGTSPPIRTALGGGQSIATAGLVDRERSVASVRKLTLATLPISPSVSGITSISTRVSPPGGRTPSVHTRLPERSLSAAAGAAAAALLGSPLIAMIGIALAAGCLGFLVWNWPPGKVFMGDVGSTFCGFVVATLPLLLPGNQRIVVLPVAVMACWAFIFDAGYTLIRRLLCGENILHSHTTHLYQRLVAMGWSHRGVATLYGGLASMSAAVAVSPLLDPAFQPAAEALAPAAILTGIALLLALSLRRPESRASEIRA